MRSDSVYLAGSVVGHDYPGRSPGALDSRWLRSFAQYLYLAGATLAHWAGQMCWGRV